MTKHVAAALLIAILAVPAFGANVIIYDSTGNTVTSSDPIASFGPIGDSFTNGSASSLVDVKLELSASSTPVGSITVALYSSTTANPPAPAAVLATLGTLNDTSLTGTPALYDFPTSPIALVAGTRYWIVASSSNGSVAVWAYGADAGTGVPGEFFSNAGGSHPNTNLPYLAQISVTPGIPGTPAPPSVILTLIGLACVGFYAASHRFVSA